MGRYAQQLRRGSDRPHPPRLLAAPTPESWDGGCAGEVLTVTVLAAPPGVPNWALYEAASEFDPPSLTAIGAVADPYLDACPHADLFGWIAWADADNNVISELSAPKRLDSP